MKQPTQQDQLLWQSMLQRSFSPRQWFEREDEQNEVAPGGEDRIMWVYRRMDLRGEPLYVVGYWSPDKEWNPDLSYATLEQAAARVHHLNGGR